MSDGRRELRAAAVFAVAGLMLVACPGGEANKTTLDLDSVSWDDPAASSSVDWPMDGVPAEATGPTQFGRGAAGGTLEVWRRLSAYSTSYLKSWRDALQSQEDPPPGDVVDAFNELAYAVTGPTGFWRKTVPQQWLGCTEDASSPVCKKLIDADRELARWDEVQKQIGELPPAGATAFLNRNRQRILSYFDTYVPSVPSATAMKETGFYRTHLAALLDTPR